MGLYKFGPRISLRNYESKSPQDTNSNGTITILEDMTKMFVHISLSDIADLNYFDILKTTVLKNKNFKNINDNILGHVVTSSNLLLRK